MQDVLKNQAALQLLDFCRENGIDPSGTHVVKNGRGFSYSLVNTDTGATLVVVTFRKNSTPHFAFDPALRTEKHTISITWSTNDVLARDASLTVKEAKVVLDGVKKFHDASVGINWDVIDAHIQMFKGGER